MTFDPKSVEVTCVTLPKDHCVQVPWKYIKVCGYSDPFFKNLYQRSLTPRWALTPHLLRSHVWLYPRFTVSNSMGIHQCMWIQWSILQNTTYYLHTTYTRYIPVLRTEWVIRQDRKDLKKENKQTKCLLTYIPNISATRSWTWNKHQCS